MADKNHRKHSLLEIVLIGLTIVLVIFTLVRTLMLWNLGRKLAPSEEEKSSVQATITPRQRQIASGETKSYDFLPFYPDITEIERTLTNGDGVNASYETKAGVTGKDVLDFYERELKKEGWQITVRDTDNSRLEALSVDEVQLRVWIYFAGGEDSGVTFHVNFRPSGADPWPPIPNQ